MKRIASVASAIGCLLLVVGPARAQTPAIARDTLPRLTLELSKPFDTDGELGGMASVLYASVRLPTSRGVAFLAEVPVAFGGLRYDEEAGTRLGNPYLAVELGRPGSAVSLELGGRAPLIGAEPNSGILVGMFSDVERYSAFAPQYAALSGIMNVGARSAAGVGFRARVGPELLLYTGDEHQDKSETMLYYAGELSRESGPLTAFVRAGGTAILSEEGSFGERSLHQLGVGASYDFGGVRPGLIARFPLDHDMKDMLKYVIGLTVQVPLR